MDSRDSWVEIGSGQEAYVLKGNITKLGGIVRIRAKKPVSVAKRINHNRVSRYGGHILFCKHLAARILEEFFLKNDEYGREHIPIPVGSFNAGYHYEFVEGSEGFPLVIFDGYRDILIEIEEWNPFVNLFNSFGFGVGSDVADAVDGRTGKNVIFSAWDINKVYQTKRLHSGWKRIDFGSASCPFDYERFEKQMLKRKKELTSLINEDYSLGLLCGKYCFLKGDLAERESKKFNELLIRFLKNYVDSM